MIYREVKPSPNLSGFVQSFWFFENEKDEIYDYVILPDGCFDLLVFHGENNKKKTSLTGLWNKSVGVTIQPKTKISAIRFKPISAEYIFNESIADILNTMREISVQALPFLESHFPESPDFALFVAVATGGLEMIVEEKMQTIDPRKTAIFDLLFKTNGNISIKSIATQIFWSNRQMSRYFKKYVTV